MPELPRILITQDNQHTLQHQVRLLEAAAKQGGGRLTIETFDLNEGIDVLLTEIEAGTRWYDWAILDLLLDDRDHDPLHSTGINAIRGLRERGLFHGYRARTARQHGVRCLAVSSALFGDSNEVGRNVKLELEKLGLRRDWLVSRPSFKDLAARLCEHLQGEGLFGGDQTTD